MVIVRISLLFTQILSISILSIWRVSRILYFCWTILFFFVKLSYFEFGLKCMHFFWSIKNLFSRWMLYFCWTILFWMWVEIWSVCTAFWNVKKKKIISIWMLYLILCRLKWIVFYSCQPNTIRLLSMSMGWYLPYSHVGLGLKNHDTIIKWVKFRLSHLVEYPYLETTRTRHANLNWHP